MNHITAYIRLSLKDIYPPEEVRALTMLICCDILGFDALDDAMTTLRLLNSKPAQSFMKSLIFEDAKRVINKDLLMRIDLMKVLEHSSSDLIDSSVSEHYSAMLRGNIAPAQLSLF